MTANAENLLPSTKRFFDAVYANNVRLLKLVLKRDKVNPNIPDNRISTKRTALLYACENRQVELAEALLRAKPIPADVNKTDANGRRPIWWAAQYGHVELAELLVKQFKCEVDVLDTQTGCTPLYRAIVSGASEVCAILVKGGANVNLRRLGYGVGAQSPLMKAVQMDNLAICQVLVNSLCDLEYKTEEGFTALHYAIAYRRYDITDFLLENVKNKHIASHSGVTPMAVAIEHDNPAMVRTLIKYGYNFNKVYKWRETPLEQAISLHNQDCALTLIHWGCKLHHAQADKPTYFYMAAAACLEKVLELMVKLKPKFLNEEWVQTANWPLALYSKPEICDCLKALSRTPFTLKELCRAAIFGYVQYFPSRHTSLPLPPELLEYISLGDLLPESMYRQQPFTEDCPLDCPFIHPWKDVQCADVEISDIDGISDTED